MNYWEECVSEALSEAGITANSEQIDSVVGWIESAHENYGMAHGHDCIPNPLVLENERLEKALRDERDKVICKTCNGRGWITTYGPIHSATSQCYKCRGEGRHLP